ncbi:hypothetical protein GCM10023321_26220 [Pseudonocardia eucalypti]|uniref:Uncharacterized protein n=1 Tax=Pseudonocardia eucalypti TaxID=648755 RepID=A0ABP9Q0C3_9PSEU
MHPAGFVIGCHARNSEDLYASVFGGDPGDAGTRIDLQFGLAGDADCFTVAMRDIVDWTELAAECFGE